MHPHSVRRVVAHVPPVMGVAAAVAHAPGVVAAAVAHALVVVAAAVVAAAAVADVVDNGSAWT